MNVLREKFFDGVKERIDPTLTQSQVSGLNAILDGLESDLVWRIETAAYALATIFHETAGTFQPIHEYGGAAYFNKRYGPNTKVGKSLGNTKAGDGARYAGRGFVQLTGRRNYRKFGIEDSPDDAMVPAIAFSILTEGMRDGLFTGKKFSDYINSKETDYVRARKIINGTDKAGLIAGYAKSFEKILKVSAVPLHPPIDTPSKENKEGSVPIGAETSIQQPPIDSGTIETTKVAGQPVVEKTTETPGSVTVEGPKPYNDIGLRDTLISDAKSIVPANTGLNIFDQLGQVTGLPPAILKVVTVLVVIAAILSVVWFFYRVVAWVMHNWRENERVKLEAHINTNPNLKDVNITK